TTWKPLSELTNTNTNKATIQHAAFSPDGNLIATAAYEWLRVWDVATGKMLQSTNAPDNFFYDCCFSPKDQLIAAACQDGNVWLWAWPTNETHLLADGDEVGRVSFSRNGRYLISGGFSRVNKAKVWGIDAFDQPLATLEHVGQVTAVAFDSTTS